ncbi:hypothetical protein V7092_25780 [Bacillus wiedmannii]
MFHFIFTMIPWELFDFSVLYIDRDAFVPHTASEVCAVIVTYVFILVMTNDVYCFWKVRKLLNELEKFSNFICTAHTY